MELLRNKRTNAVDVVVAFVEQRAHGNLHRKKAKKGVRLVNTNRRFAGLLWSKDLKVAVILDRHGSEDAVGMQSPFEADSSQHCRQVA